MISQLDTSIIIGLAILSTALSFFSFYPVKGVGGKRWSLRNIFIITLLALNLLLLAFKGYLDKNAENEKAAREQQHRNEVLALNNEIISSQDEILSKLDSIGLGYDMIRNELYVVDRETVIRFATQAENLKNALNNMNPDSLLLRNDSVGIVYVTSKAPAVAIEPGNCETKYSTSFYSGGKLRIINQTGIPIEIVNATAAQYVYASGYSINMFLNAGQDGRTPLLHVSKRAQNEEYANTIMDYKLNIRSVPSDGSRAKYAEINAEVVACEENVLLLTENNVFFR
ncbi:hypothetical protein [Parapedobacter koreensis]|uniref:Uncharacterized protein n=1 Tax=Parapedobacter koreensis TaxID=332977 RepID=A0A1H7PZM1_9SPHI|nr:hypothetical protein [Parapedobacter koreensis]SEL41036.1 hypothetical protein SAMN05421740_10590 [Parapedobacter koreensis]